MINKKVIGNYYFNGIGWERTFGFSLSDYTHTMQSLKKHNGNSYSRGVKFAARIAKYNKNAYGGRSARL